MKKAADIGISVNIVHPSAEPNKENERGEKIKRAQESLAYLADAAEKCGSVIAGGKFAEDVSGQGFKGYSGAAERR